MPDNKDDDGGFDLGDLVDQAKDLVGDHKDEVKDGIDAAVDFVGDQVGIDNKTAKSVKQTAKGLVDDVGSDDPPARKKAPKAKKKPTSA